VKCRGEEGLKFSAWLDHGWADSIGLRATATVLQRAARSHAALPCVVTGVQPYKKVRWPSICFLQFLERIRMLRFSSLDNQLTVEEIITYKVLQVTALAFAPDGRTLAAGCADGSVVLWDLAEARRTAAVAERHRGPVWSLAFSHGAGGMLASGAQAKGCARPVVRSACPARAGSSENYQRWLSFPVQQL